MKKLKSVSDKISDQPSYHAVQLAPVEIDGKLISQEDAHFQKFKDDIEHITFQLSEILDSVNIEDLDKISCEYEIKFAYGLREILSDAAEEIHKRSIEDLNEGANLRKYYAFCTNSTHSLAGVYGRHRRKIEKYLEQFENRDVSSEGAEARFLELEAFAKRTGGRWVAEYAKRLFPEIVTNPEVAGKLPAKPQLPEAAPELWPGGKSTKETPPEFIMRVYQPWIGKGLTMADVRHLDEPLAQALYHHIRKERPLPEGFDLPTKYEDQRSRDEAAAQTDPDAKLRKYWRDGQAKRRERRRGDDTGKT